MKDIEIEEPDGEERPRDLKIDEVKEVLLREVFQARPDGVFYQRQVEVIFERDFYHWITAKGVNELADEGRIMTATSEHPNTKLKFYWSRSNRYWKRGSQNIERLVLKFSDTAFTRAIGRQGELMVDAALPRVGFMPRGSNVNSYGGKTWGDSDHDLDRVFERDGITYGVEIKNTLSYIDRLEMRQKMDMCDHLELVPLFIVRAALKSYINEVRLRGGLTLVLGVQLYPFGSEDFAKEVSSSLGLKVACPKAIDDGTLQRLVKMHQSRAVRPKNV